MTGDSEREREREGGRDREKERGRVKMCSEREGEKGRKRLGLVTSLVTSEKFYNPLSLRTWKI